MRKALSFVVVVLSLAVSTAPVAFATEPPAQAPVDTEATANQTIDIVTPHQFQLRASPLSLLWGILNVEFAVVATPRMLVGLDLAYRFGGFLPTRGLTQGEWRTFPDFPSRWMLQVDYLVDGEVSERAWMISPFAGILSQDLGPSADASTFGLTIGHQWFYESSLVMRIAAGVETINPHSIGQSAEIFPVFDVSIGWAL